MKKTYINPNIEVVKISNQMQILAGSDPEKGFTKSGAGTLDSGDTSGNLGRGFDFFDED